MSDSASAVIDWLTACSDAARLPASSTTHYRGSCKRCGDDELHKMPNHMNDVECSERHPLRAKPTKQPPLGLSGAPHSSHSYSTRALSSRTPSLPPPIDEPEIGFVSSTAALDLSVSDTAISTRLTSVSNHQGGGDGSVRSSEIEIDGSLAGKRTRSRSPIKKVVDLSAARPPIRYEPSEVPPEINFILKRFKAVFKGKNLMPLSLKVRRSLCPPPLRS